MNDERAMILKMLQEGKITVEEADALLDVLNESDEKAASGFAASDASAEAGADSSGSDDSSDHASDDGSAHGDRTSDGGSSGGRRFRLDFEFDGVRDSLRSAMGAVRETMKGVRETLKESFESGDFSFDVFGDPGRRMGRVRRDDEQTIVLRAGSSEKLRVANAWGDVTINGSDEDQIEVEASISAWAGSEEAADQRLQEVNVALVDEDGWVIRADSGDGRSVRIDYEITVPRSFSVTASTGSGDVRLEDLNGSHTVSTASGDVEVSSIGTDPGFRQQISTRSGDVVGASILGQTTVSSLAGDVEINGLRGHLTVAASSGDVSVTEGVGSVEAKSLSGDVEVELEAVGSEPIVVTALSGDVHLALPESAAVELEAKTAAGETTVDLDLDNAGRSGKKITGTRNGGGLRVEVSTLAGDVTVEAS